MIESELKQISDFVLARSGIVLNNTKAYLVESRLGPVAEQHGFADVSELARKLSISVNDVQVDVVDALTTNETFFFRDKTPFALFEDVILPNLLAARSVAPRLRIWCAAASTGQEPYSLAMLLHKHKARLGHKQVEIVATDISPSALKRANEGLYSQFEVQRGLPVQMLMEHFTQEGTQWRISESMRKMVKFSDLNLMKSFSHLGQFDVVYCRNVLIYFDNETKRRVLNNIRGVMKPDGYLVMGAAETMMGHSEQFERAEGQRGLYQPVSGAQKMSA